MSTRDRKGLSALDVIVVLVILMVMAAVFLPAMHDNGHRAAHRRSDCKNKLKQIAIALHNYHETFNTFPPGWIAVRGASSGDEERSSAYGWGTYIMPFMDHAPLYKKIEWNAADPSFQFQAANGAKFAHTALPAYRCPSDLGEAQDLTASIAPIGTTNFVANFGVGIPTRQHTREFMQGMFGENSRIRIRDIRDGTTNTVMAGERRLPRTATYWEPGKSEGTFNSYWAGLPKGTNPLAIVGTVTDGTLPVIGSPAESERRKAIANGSDPLNLSGPLNGANASSPTLRTFRVNKLSDGTSLSPNGGPVSAGYSSYHTGGAHIVLADGSVRFISDSIDLQIYINLMRRTDGQVLGEF